MATRVREGTKLEKGQFVRLRKNTPMKVLDDLGLRGHGGMSFLVNRDERNLGRTYIEAPSGVRGVDRCLLLISG